MDDQTKLRYETESKSIRAELKKWEGDWANAHGGSKPGRHDIKDNPEIGK